jgi:DMSO/TMAO reductase YedYZ molybdopterin-dependent catalytic subunit
MGLESPAGGGILMNISRFTDGYDVNAGGESDRDMKAQDPFHIKPDPAAANAQSPRDVGKDERMHVRSTTPLNIETAVDALDSPITPVQLFFVRNNQPCPEFNPADWRLVIDGHVEQPYSLTYADLRRMEPVTYTAVLECCGNSRSRFAETGREAEGIPWGNGAIGNAVWEGIPVRPLLEAAGVRPGAVQVDCTGGAPECITRGVDVEKLLDDAILAYAMNGRPLQPVHGRPVRLVVPGWGGINWIKWITRMRVLPHESESPYNQQRYIVVDEHGQTTTKVRRIRVKSLIANIAPGALLLPGAHAIQGFAWSAGRSIARVEVSVDGGTTWQSARLLDETDPRAWRQFEWVWDAQPGEHVLAVRATDSAGDQQPATVPFNQQGYLMNAIERVPVQVVEL